MAIRDAGSVTAPPAGVNRWAQPNSVVVIAVGGLHRLAPGVKAAVRPRAAAACVNAGKDEVKTP